MEQDRPLCVSIANDRLRLGLILYAMLASACAAGSSESSPSGLSTAGVRVRQSVGGRAALDLTTEASVLDSTVSASPATVWSVLPSVFETLEIDTPVVDRGSLTVGNPGFRAGRRILNQRLSNYLDCGNSFGRPNADRYEVTLQIAVQLEPAADGGTVITTMLDGYASPRDVSGNSLHCRSKGVLERRVLALTTERLSAA